MYPVVNKRGKYLLLCIAIQCGALAYAFLAQMSTFAEILLPFIVAELLVFAVAFCMAIVPLRAMREGRIRAGAKFAIPHGFAQTRSEVVFELHNETPFVLRCCTVYADTNNQIAIPSDEIPIFNSPPHSIHTLKIPIDFLQSGLGAIHGIHLVCTDFTSCFEIVDYLEIQKTIEITIEPGSRERRTLQKFNVSKRAQNSTTALETERIRDFVPGDSPKHIAWRLSAHRDRHMLRVPQTLSWHQINFFVDVSQSMRANGRDALDQALGVVLAQAHTHTGLLSLLCYDEQVIESLAPCAPKSFIRRLQALIPSIRVRYDTAHCGLNTQQLAHNVATHLLKYNKLDFFLEHDEVDTVALSRYCKVLFGQKDSPLLAAAQTYGHSVAYSSPPYTSDALGESLRSCVQKRAEEQSIVILSSFAQSPLGANTVESLQRLHKRKIQVDMISFPCDRDNNGMQALLYTQEQKRNLALLRNLGLQVHQLPGAPKSYN